MTTAGDGAPNAVRVLRVSSGSVCPYLEDHEERKLWTLLGPDDAATLDGLTRAGFRRSGRLVYRPACAGCVECRPARIPLDGFAPSRSQRRAVKRNGDLAMTLAAPRASDEHFALFSRYVAARHADGGMADMTREEFARMIEENTGAAQLVEWRDGAGALIAACLVDRLACGVSAVYSYFEPGAPASRSIGTAIIASLAIWGAKLGAPHLYLGYWIPASPKMAYKGRFRPLEMLDHGAWRPAAADMVKTGAEPPDRFRLGEMLG